ncbi:hypothetical protein GP475_06930 [Corynebacterium poyangense]|uniref:Uncharacterized protein n=1 Tax=Corynebacterium poyangense TaxID=2684405 RepID=A0A7H0SPC1_9CORY|nr:hypothetical protein [Corynebacterium poyangense]MBZ8177972.1 hypothetical protein [Corynebacterium poyangense]QNQ90396.1 hypothetical protein GP475_06930 [Corynebacterium poyangense]
MTTDLKSIGLDFPRWQDAVEAAIATDKLAVTGEVRDGQLIQYSDASGARIIILAVEPFATFAGFESTAQVFGHLSMINDVLALVEIVDAFGHKLTEVTLNLAQGPLLADAPAQQWQQLHIAALAVDYQLYNSAADYTSATGEISTAKIHSPGADIIAAGSGAEVPDASVDFLGRVIQSDYRVNELTGQRFIHVVLDSVVSLDVCLPDAESLPAKDSILSGRGVLTGSVIIASGCGGSGGCGCGHGGCGGH